MRYSRAAACQTGLEKLTSCPSNFGDLTGVGYFSCVTRVQTGGNSGIFGHPRDKPREEFGVRRGKMTRGMPPPAPYVRGAGGSNPSLPT